MDNYGFLSILPPVIAIVLALKTRQVYVSLVTGIWLGWLILNNWNLLDGTIGTLEGFVNVFKSAGNTRTIMFSALVGSLLMFIQYSGGVQGFINSINAMLKRFDAQKSGRSRIMVQLFAQITGILLFIETSISSLTVGTLYRPVFDKLKIPREKLAYIADATSAPSSILIPVNAWGAFIMGLLITQGIEHPLPVMASALLYNFYPMLTILMVTIVIVTKKDFGPMALAEKRTRETGKLHNDDAKPLISDEITSMRMKEGVVPKSMNMVVPLLTMIVMMPVTLIYTGWGEVSESRSGFDHIIQAIGKGSGSSAVLYSVTMSLIVAMILYRMQGIMKTRKMVEIAMKGIGELMPLALLMMLAFSISDVCNELGTGNYVARFTEGLIAPQYLPALVFVISSFIAFSTGTSWGTFAIMMSIVVPIAQIHGVNLYLMIAATLGGGVFGDHCSPISDTTIISSMASASDHIDHVKTQLPYALLTGAVTVVLYLILGFVMQ
jgi:Na+/H+ antiporter NhaC